MPFVKLDCGLLDSTLWSDADACRVFLASLLMAVPFELTTPTAAIAVRSLEPLGYVVPPGWYGFVPAAGPGIVRRAGIAPEIGIAALERLASAEAESRSPEHDGRRMVRISRGYLVLNYMAFRDRDHTIAERQRRFRARKRDLPFHLGSESAISPCNGVTSLRVTHADADVDAERNKIGSKDPRQVEATRPSGQTCLNIPTGADGTTPHPELLHAVGGNGRGDPLRAAVERIFDYWRGMCGHPAARLSRERYARIRARLAEGGTEEECRAAIEGCAGSAFHRGENEHGRVYDGIGLIFRNREKLETFGERSRESTAPVPKPAPSVCAACGGPLGGSWARTARGPAHPGACRDAILRGEDAATAAGGGGREESGGGELAPAPPGADAAGGGAPF